MESVNPVEIGGNARKFLTGPRLAELNKEFEQNGGEWKEFKIGELFEWQAQKEFSPLKIKSLTVKNGKKYPFYGQSASNKGIISYECLDESVLNNKNGKPIILIHSNNQNCVYLQTPFYLKDGHGATSVLSCHFLNEKNAQFLITCIQKIICKKFSYNNKATKIALKNTFIFLPAAPDGMPDFSYMERYIGELEQARVSELEQARVSELAAYLRAAGLENYDLTAAEQTALDDFKNGKIRFKEFKITGENGIFSVKNTHSILKNQIIPNSGNYPYVTAGETNNSILTYISYDESFLEKGNSIMIAGKSMVITYQEKNYFSNDSHNLSLSLKIDSNKTYKHFLFLASALYKSLHNKYSWGDSISKEKIKKDHLWLPVIDDKNIDYNFMESFITAQQKLAIRDVVLWKDKVISETRKITKV